MPTKPTFRSTAGKVIVKTKPSVKSPQGSTYSKVGKPKSTKSKAAGSSDDDDNALKTASSENLAKLPTLSEEEYIYFKLVQDGDLNGLQDFIKSKLFAKIHINKTDRLGFSALHHAVRRQDEEVVDLLLSQEGILTYDTLLHAIQEENIAITKTILAHEDVIRGQPSSLPPPNQSLTRVPSQSQASTLGGQGKGWPITKSLAVTALAAGLSLSPTSIRSSTKVTLKRSLDDLEAFDSEFPVYITSFWKAAQTGNYDLMEMFYSRGERLETTEEHHNCGCPCRVCSVADKSLTTAYERLHLYQALTNPKYICFISGKTLQFDPINYAMDKIIRCSQLIENEQAFDDKYSEYNQTLSDFMKDFLNLCRSNEEAELFLSIPESNSAAGVLIGEYPRLWKAVGLQLFKVVAHPHAQNVVYKKWAATPWPEWDSYSPIRIFAEVLLRLIFLPFIAIYLWFGSRSRFGKKMSSPVSRFLNWMAAYTIFLALVFAQAKLPQRCNNKRNVIPYSVIEGKCNQRGAPNIGTEWMLVIYILGFFVSMIKRHSIPWFWSSPWSWYELGSHLLFVATFVCWAVAHFSYHPDEDRKQWNQYYPEVLAELFLSVGVVIAFGRTYRLFQLHPIAGPLQIALGRMVKSFFSAALMYSIVIFAFSLGLNAIYIPYQDLEGFDKSGKATTQSSPFGNILTAPEELFWSLLALSGNDKVDIIQLGSKLNATTLITRHHWVNETAGKFLFGTFHVVGVVMLFNLLVAYFSAHGDGAMENADAEWKFARTQVYMTFIKDTVLPPPFNLIPTLPVIIKFFEYLGLLCLEDIGKRSATCTWRQCCFIDDEIDRDFERDRRRSYRQLILELTLRYKGFIQNKENQEPATSDDVKEIGEQLAELKSQVESKLRELERLKEAELKSQAEFKLKSQAEFKLKTLEGLPASSNKSARTSFSASEEFNVISSNALSASKNALPGIGGTVSVIQSNTGTSLPKNSQNKDLSLQKSGSGSASQMAHESTNQVGIPRTSSASRGMLSKASILPGSLGSTIAPSTSGKLTGLSQTSLVTPISGLSRKDSRIPPTSPALASPSGSGKILTPVTQLSIRLPPPSPVKSSSGEQLSKPKTLSRVPSFPISPKRLNSKPTIGAIPSPINIKLPPSPSPSNTGSKVSQAPPPPSPITSVKSSESGNKLSLKVLSSQKQPKDEQGSV